MDEKKEKILRTGIDRFLSAVQSRKTVDAEELAQELGVDIATIDAWTSILEKEGILNSAYDRRGDLTISLGGAKQEAKEKKAVLVKDIKKDTKKELKELHNFMDEREKILKAEEKQLKEFEKLLEKDLDVVQDIDSEIDEISGKTSKLKNAFTRLIKTKKNTAKETHKIAKFVEKKLKTINEIENDIEMFIARKQEIDRNSKVISRLLWSIKLKSKDDKKRAAKARKINKAMAKARSSATKGKKRYKKAQSRIKKL